MPKLRFPQNFYCHISGFPQNFHFFALLQESPSAHWLNRTALKLSDSTQTYKQAGDDSIELCPVNDRHIVEYIIKEMRMGAFWLISSYTEGLLILQQQEGVSKVTDTPSLLITQ